MRNKIAKNIHSRVSFDDIIESVGGGNINLTKEKKRYWNSLNHVERGKKALVDEKADRKEFVRRGLGESTKVKSDN